MASLITRYDMLFSGNHEYKFFVDGEWRNDPNAPTITNVHGTLNNIVEVKQSDFDVFQGKCSIKFRSVSSSV